jgi:very-long-chain (3R)-3-hydroxyacyl-CoA dehydratase
VGYTLYESVTTDCSSGVDIVPGWLPESPLNGKVCVFHDNGPDGNYLLTQLQFYQTGALLEVLHAALKIVPSNPVVVFQQVLSRILQVWLIFTVAPEQTVTMPAMWLMAFAWSLTEVIRYSLYTMKQLGMSAPFVLEYCRLTFFIVLYPIGVYGENMCQYRASQTFEGSTPRSTVSYKWFVYLCMSAYPFLFPGLYMHMFKQRNKFLKGPVKKEEPKPEAGVQFPDEDKDAKGKRYPPPSPPRPTRCCYFTRFCFMVCLVKDAKSKRYDAATSLGVFHGVPRSFCKCRVW